MKAASFVSCAVLALLLVAPLGAQSRGKVPQKITADVPFDFMVKQVMFPAGRYTVTRTGDQTFCLRARRGLEALTFKTESIRTGSRGGRARLMFWEENGHFHLRELWMNATAGREVLASPRGQLHAVHASGIEVLANCTSCE